MGSGASGTRSVARGHGPPTPGLLCLGSQEGYACMIDQNAKEKPGMVPASSLLVPTPCCRALTRRGPAIHPSCRRACAAARLPAHGSLWAPGVLAERPCGHGREQDRGKACAPRRRFGRCARRVPVHQRRFAELMTMRSGRPALRLRALNRPLPLGVRGSYTRGVGKSTTSQTEGGSRVPGRVAALRGCPRRDSGQFYKKVIGQTNSSGWLSDSGHIFFAHGMGCRLHHDAPRSGCLFPGSIARRDPFGGWATHPNVPVCCQGLALRFGSGRIGWWECWCLRQGASR